CRGRVGELHRCVGPYRLAHRQAFFVAEQGGEELGAAEGWRNDAISKYLKVADPCGYPEP
ncbi:hypothetical protein HF668_05605, partial [Acidithiobacillus ferridurans]|uniref:hypothetical protein n=1 Tax=Acidithiobacillus ferridurans TaxID=1232575 RepID=UPI001C06CDAB